MRPRNMRTFLQGLSSERGPLRSALLDFATSAGEALALGIDSFRALRALLSGANESKTKRFCTGGAPRQRLLQPCSSAGDLEAFANPWTWGSKRFRCST